jgi:hypothetical protein
MGNDNHVVVSHKLCGFQGRVGRCFVMMKEPVMVASRFRYFSLCVFSQASRNVTVKVRVDRSVRRTNSCPTILFTSRKENNEHALY